MNLAKEDFLQGRDFKIFLIETQQNIYLQIYLGLNNKFDFLFIMNRWVYDFDQQDKVLNQRYPLYIYKFFKINLYNKIGKNLHFP